MSTPKELLNAKVLLIFKYSIMIIIIVIFFVLIILNLYFEIVFNLAETVEYVDKISAEG